MSYQTNLLFEMLSDEDKKFFQLLSEKFRCELNCFGGDPNLVHKVDLCVYLFGDCWSYYCCTFSIHHSLHTYGYTRSDLMKCFHEGVKYMSDEKRMLFQPFLNSQNEVILAEDMTDPALLISAVKDYYSKNPTWERGTFSDENGYMNNSHEAILESLKTATPDMEYFSNVRDIQCMEFDVNENFLTYFPFAEKGVALTPVNTYQAFLAVDFFESEKNGNGIFYKMLKEKKARKEMEEA